MRPSGALATVDMRFLQRRKNLKQCMCCDHVVLAQCPSQSLRFMPSWWNWSCSPRGSGRLGSGHGRSPQWTLQRDDRSAWSFVIFLIRESTSLGSNRCKRTTHLALKLLSLTKQFCFKVQQKTNTRVVPCLILIFSAQCPTHLQHDLSIFV